MKKIKLGKTDLLVSKLSLGGLFLSSLGLGYEESKLAVQRAFELGINYIDTAPGYADSEIYLGKILERTQYPHYISTKLGGRPVPFNPKNIKHILSCIEESLRLLKREQIDILFVHEPDRPGQYDWYEDWDNFYGPVNDILEELKAKGLVRYTGIAGTTVYEMTRIVERGNYDVLLTAFNYSLLFQEAGQTLIPAAKRQGMGIVAGSPLQQGWFSTRYDRTIRDKPPAWLSPQRREQLLCLYDYVDQIGMSLPELAMRFVLSNPDIDTVLGGARTAKEVELNVKSIEAGALDNSVLKDLKKLARMVPFRPCEEPFIAHFNPEDHYRGAGSLW